MALAVQGSLRRRPLLGVALFLLLVAVTGFLRLQGNDASARLVDRGQAAIALRVLDAVGALDPDASATDGHREKAKERSAPGYALVLAVAARLDASFAAVLVCRARGADCGAASIRPLQLVQLAVAVVGLGVAMSAASLLSGAPSVALLTGLLLFAASPIGEAASYAAPYVWVPALLALFTLLAVAAHLQRSIWLTFVAGAALGILALFVPATLPAPLATSVALALAARRNGAKVGGALLRGLVLIAGTASVLALALMLLVGADVYEIDAALRALAYDLELRAAFSKMSAAMALTGALLPLPVVGGLVDLLAPAAWTNPFGPFVPGTFVSDGDAAWRASSQRALAAPGLLSGLSDRLAADAAGYLLSMPAVAMRGLLGSADLIGLVGLLHMKTALAWHRADGRLLLLVAVALPYVVLLLANTAFTANLPMTNMPLAFLHAYAIAYVAGRL